MEPMHPLRTYRHRHGITLAAVAAQLDVVPSTVSRWENGVRVPPIRMMRRIVNLTNGEVSAESLLGLPASDQEQSNYSSPVGPEQSVA